jgi:hypothetical protein
MSRGQRRVAILIAIVGTIASVLALSGFILRVHGNRLDLPPVPTVPAFYAAVGDAYGEGFAAGFALCFFLALLAVAIGTWREGRTT